MEDLELTNENKKIYYMCHYCQKLKKINQVINCTDDDCQEGFCKECIEKYFHNIINLKELLEEVNENGWICFKCQKLCECDLCSKIKNQQILLNTEKKNFKYNLNTQNELLNEAKLFYNLKNNIKLNTENEKSDNLLIFENNKIFDFLNDKNINEKKSNEKNEKKKNNENKEKNRKKSNKESSLIDKNSEKKNIKQNIIQSKNKIGKRLKLQLLKTAKLCEHFYRHKCKCQYFKKECIICSKNEHHINELLRFKNSKDFINYLRYIFLYNNEITDYKHENFKKNKKELLNFYQDFERGIILWSFNSPKIICKCCILNIVNEKNALERFKNYLAEDDNNKISVIINYEESESDSSMSKVPNYISEKLLINFQNILNIILQNIYKYILVMNYINKDIYYNIYQFQSKNYNLYLFYFNQIKSEIENTFKEYIKFQEYYQHNINEFIGIYHFYISKDSQHNFLQKIFSLKIENNNNSEKIIDVIKKFIQSITESINRFEQKYK